MKPAIYAVEEADVLAYSRPSTRYRRQARTTPVNSDGEPLCRVCVGSIPFGRYGTCSNACLYAWRLNTDGFFMRREVFTRDKGICSTCGLDCVVKRVESADVDLATLALAGWPDPTERTFWEVDHARPIRDGGGFCDLANLQTLCCPCHRAKSAKESAK